MAQIPLYDLLMPTPHDELDRRDAPRELDSKRQTAVALLTGGLMFAASEYYQHVPSAKYVLFSFLGAAALWNAWLFRPSTVRLPLKRGDSLDFVPAGPRELLPNLVTALRPVFGLLTCLALLRSEWFWAYNFYLIGNATDIMDGAMARDLKGTTAAGKRFDAAVDLLFNCITGFSLLWLCLRNYPTIDWTRLTFLGLNVVGFAWVWKHWGPFTAAQKYMSGLLRVVLLGLLISLLPSKQLLLGIFGAGLMLGGFYYEHLVVQADRLKTKK